jgi:arylsulfatase A-like enzyme
VLYANFRQHGYDYVDTPDTMKERAIRETQTITGIDRFVGAVRETLDRLGLADNTIIIFSSDHGIMSGEFGLGGKALNYEPCLRVPMIIMQPGVPEKDRGARSRALAQSIDIAPTLLDYAGVRAPDTMQGKSLRRIVEGKTTKLRNYAFSENLWSTYFGNPRIESVRTADWKYLRYFKNDRTQFANVTQKTLYVVTPSQITNYAAWLTASIKGEQPVYEELYNLASDPHEAVNLVDRPAYADVLKKMRQQCQTAVKAAKGDANQPPAAVVTPNIREGKSKPKAK